VVIPQFLVTGLSSIIFAFFEDGVTGIHPGAGHAGAGVGPGGAVGDVSDSDGNASTTTADRDQDIGFDEIGGGAAFDASRKVARYVGMGIGRGLRRTLLEKRGEDELGGGGSPDGIGLIFKVGGVSSLIAAALCWKLARDLRRG
jgi:hypothetical protein